MRLFLARHTEPEGGEVWTILGHKDVPLSDAGKRHWTEIARQFDAVPLKAVYCSDLQRSWWCAELVARRKGLAATRLAALREMNCGSLDGMTREEAQAKFPEAFEGLERDPVRYRIPEGETLEEVSRRVMSVLRRVTASNGDALLVAHAVVNRTVVCDALGLSLANAYRIEQSYGGLTVIEYGDRHPVVLTLNSTRLPQSLTAPGS